MSTLGIPSMLSHVNSYQKGLMYRGKCCAMISSSVVQDGEIPVRKSNYSCCQKGSRSALFFSAFRRLNVAEEK